MSDSAGRGTSRSPEGVYYVDKRFSVRATGDSVGNIGTVEVARCQDGSVALGIHRRENIETLWLTYDETVRVVTALLRCIERAS